jgi:hypothetical protein
LPLLGGSEVELSDPAVVQTSSDFTSSIKKVEYSLNGKLVATVSSPPYSYTVKTTNLRNGKYTLTTKTYYDSGKVDSSNSSLIVKNPMNLTQIMLQLKHYAWVLIVLALIAGGAIWFMFFRGAGGGDEFGDTDVSGGFGVPGMYDGGPDGGAGGSSVGAGGQIMPNGPPPPNTGGGPDFGAGPPPGMPGVGPDFGAGPPPGIPGVGPGGPNFGAGPPPGIPGAGPGPGGPDPYGRY